MSKKSPGAYWLGLMVIGLSMSACAGPKIKVGSTDTHGRDRVAILDRSEGGDHNTGSPTRIVSAGDSVVNVDWSQPAYSPTHRMPHARIGDHPEPVWSRSIGAGSSREQPVLTQPIVAAGRIYTMDSSGEVRAFDATEGKRFWSVNPMPDDKDITALAGGMTFDDGILYVTTGYGDVVAMRAETGDIVWRASLRTPHRAAPLVTEGRVFVVSVDNQTTALDKMNGHVLWHHNGIAENTSLMGAATPTVLGDSVVVAYSSGEIYCLRAHNGRVAWSYAVSSPSQMGALPAIADIRAMPVVAEGHVLAVSHSGHAAAVNGRTGDKAWDVDLGGVNTPVVFGRNVALLTGNRALVILDLHTGEVVWTRALPDHVDPEDKMSDALDWVGPVLANDTLWLANNAGQVVGYAVGDGTQKQTIDVDEAIHIPPIIAMNTMFVVTDDGHLVAIR